MENGNDSSAASHSTPDAGAQAAISLHERADRASAKMGISPESGVPQNLVYAGIAVGLALILFGFSPLVAGKSSLVTSLMICVGFGIVLASFGSRAGGSWAGWTATGAGAMAVFPFLILQHYNPPSSLSPAKRGQLRGDLSKIADVRIIDENPLYEFRDPTTSSIRFIILDRHLKSPTMRVQVDTTDKGPGREFFELIANAQTICDRYLTNSENPNEVVQWDFDYKNRLIRDGSTIIFTEPDRLDEKLLPIRPDNHAAVSKWPTMIHSALAQSAPALPSPDQDGVENSKPANPIDLNISMLNAEDAAVRRNARDTLTSIGPDVVAPLMAALRVNAADYRVNSGRRMCCQRY